MKNLITCEPAGPRVSLSFKYDPNLIANIRRVTGAQWDSDLNRWTVPRGAFIEVVDAVGASRIVCDDAELKALIQSDIVIPEPTFVLPDFNPQKPTWTQQVRPDAGLTADDFQATGTSWLAMRPVGILGDEVGNGKCKMVLDAIDYEQNAFLKSTLRPEGSENRITTVLVVCKSSNLDTWLIEATKFTPNFNLTVYRGTPKQRQTLMHEFLSERSPGVQVLVVSYEILRIEIEGISKIVWDWAVLDEAHKIKSSPLNGNQAKIAELIHSVQATRRYAVTANLIVNSAEDAWNPLRWLQLESRDWATFEHETIKTRTINPSPYVEVKKVIGSKPEGMRKLRRLIADNMIARHDMLDLPPKIYQDIIVTLKPEEAKFYEEAARSFEYDSEGALTQAPMLMHDLDLDEGDMIPNQFVRKLRLKQITSSIEVFLGKSYPSSKIVALKELIETATDSGKKVLVGSQFRSVVAALERELKDYNPAVIHGGVTTQAAKGKLSPRGLQQEKFQTDPTCRVFIGSVAACREGLTLTAGSVVCHIDKEWSPVYVEQFEGRAQRLTQTSHVLIYSLKAVLPNGKQTVDFDIEDDLDRKDRLISELVR